MGYGGKNKKFHPAAGGTFRLQMRKAAPAIGHRCPVAELAGVEFVITDDYTRASALRKTMSMNSRIRLRLSRQRSGRREGTEHPRW
jgi:hypothetical protein